MTPSITEANVRTVLGNFLLNLIPGIGIEVGQANRIPEPKSPDFIILTTTQMPRLGTNIDTWDNSISGGPTIQSVKQPTRWAIQLDIHGEDSTDNAQVIATMFRDAYAVDFFATYGFDMAPLYTSDPLQAPFINAEAQYEDRWTLEVMIQVNPVVTLPQQFADTVNIGLIEVDATYPPTPGAP